MRRLVEMIRFALLVTGATVLLATFTPLGYWFALQLAGEWPTHPSGTLVVAGADMEDPETMGLSSYRRAFYARLYWRQGTFTQIVLLGHGVAPAMRKWLVYEGVPATAILAENESESTLANAQGLKKILAEWKAHTGKENPVPPLVLLTSDYHCWRARRVFATAGIEITVQPVPDATKRWGNISSRWGVCMDLAMESLKIAGYFVRGWI